MRIGKSSYPIILLVLILSGSCSDKISDNQIDYNYTDSAYLKLTISNCNFIIFKHQFITLFPFEHYKKQEFLSNDSEIIYSYKTATPVLIDITLKDRFQTYLIPGDTLIITFDCDPNLGNSTHILEGEHGKIYKYFKARRIHFGYWDNTNELTNFMSPTNTIEEVFFLIDSLFLSEIEFLKNYHSTSVLPDWFFQTIKADLEYGRVVWRKGAVIQLKLFFEENLVVPESYYIFDEVGLYNPSAKYSRSYYDCLMSYFLVDIEKVSRRSMV